MDFTKYENHPMFDEGKERMKNYLTTVKHKKKKDNLKKRIKSRKKRKRIYKLWKNQQNQQLKGDLH